MLMQFAQKLEKLIGLLYRRFYGSVDNDGMMMMYKVLVYPHLEYAAPVWAPHLSKDVLKLENVQKLVENVFEILGIRLH